MFRYKLFRPSRPDFIETKTIELTVKGKNILFRPSRPDFIETNEVGKSLKSVTLIVPAF